ncbi:hypothetical protein MRX96_015522 [Rhipicephalus microplus]
MGMKPIDTDGRPWGLPRQHDGRNHLIRGDRENAKGAACQIRGRSPFVTRLAEPPPYYARHRVCLPTRGSSPAPLRAARAASSGWSAAGRSSRFPRRLSHLDGHRSREDIGDGGCAHKGRD